MIRKTLLNYCIAQNGIIKLILDVIITLWILIFHTHSCFVAGTISICLPQLTKALMRFLRTHMCVCERDFMAPRSSVRVCVCESAYACRFDSIVWATPRPYKYITSLLFMTR